jgi:hypothetical protein
LAWWTAAGLVAGHRAAGTTPQACAEADAELVEGERLGQIVVGSSVEAAHAIADVAASGEDDDRDTGATSAEAPKEIQAVEVGQAEVEQDRVGLGCAHSEECFPACDDVLHRIAVGLEALDEEGGDALLVLD